MSSVLTTEHSHLKHADCAGAHELLATLDDKAATDSSRFGPKAANLAMLRRAGLPTPPGICLSADAYRLQLETSGLQAAAVAAANLERAGGDARAQISEVRIGLFEQPVTPLVLEPLLREWKTLCGNTGALTVVRSSALMEDCAGSNFAGQFETFLGLESEEEFLTSVRACWAALWSPRALKYMATRDISPADSAMALCIQPLVQARVSGGGMSRTASGNMLVSATWGLGTSIAQGQVVPDLYELTRDAKVVEVVSGRKEHSVHCSHNAALLAARPAAIEGNSGACLTEAQAIEMSRLMLEAEHVMGGTVEVEWALDSQGFKMLQARPLPVQEAQVLDKVWSSRPGLKGQPSGTGWATGRSCVVSCECELSRVAPGDILITRVAGPALSEALSKVAGVVAELGGSTSHLASLARERGVPMVLGVLQATRKIPDGIQIAVDGVTGMVRWQH